MLALESEYPSLLMGVIGLVLLVLAVALALAWIFLPFTIIKKADTVIKYLERIDSRLYVIEERAKTNPKPVSKPAPPVRVAEMPPSAFDDPKT